MFERQSAAEPATRFHKVQDTPRPSSRGRQHSKPKALCRISRGKQSREPRRRKFQPTCPWRGSSVLMMGHGLVLCFEGPISEILNLQNMYIYICIYIYMVTPPHDRPSPPKHRPHRRFRAFLEVSSFSPDFVCPEPHPGQNQKTKNPKSHGECGDSFVFLDFGIFVFLDFFFWFFGFAM